jgi:hypothetical protein
VGERKYNSVGKNPTIITAWPKVVGGSTMQQQKQDELLRQQLIERLIKAEMDGITAKEAVNTLLIVFDLTQDRGELIREIEELALLFEEDTFNESQSTEQSKHNIA